jgi:cell division septal protein FtsQ
VKPGKPIVAEPDQRYWRARANRRVRKARLTRNLLRWSLVALLNAVFLGGLGYIGLHGVRRVAGADEFALQRIEVEGARRASEEAIRERLKPAMGRSLFDLDLDRVRAVVRRDPWVQRAAVRRVLPRTLRVSVSERTPVALAVIRRRLHVVDGTGHVVGPLREEALNGLPVLTGLERMEDEQLIDALRSGVRLVSRLRRAAGPFAEAIAELDLSRGDRVTARLAGRGPRLLLDPLRVERNVMHYLALREEIDRRVGPTDYVDLRWRDRIAVMPAFRSGEDG